LYSQIDGYDKSNNNLGQGFTLDRAAPPLAIGQQVKWFRDNVIPKPFLIF